MKKKLIKNILKQLGLLCLLTTLVASCKKSDDWVPRASIEKESSIFINQKTTFKAELNEEYMKDGSVEFFWEMPDEEILEGKEIDYTFMEGGSQTIYLRTVRMVDGKSIVAGVKQDIEVQENKAKVYFISPSNVGNDIRMFVSRTDNSGQTVGLYGYLDFDVSNELNEADYCGGDKILGQVNYFEDVKPGNYEVLVYGGVPNPNELQYTVSFYVGVNGCHIVEL